MNKNMTKGDKIVVKTFIDAKPLVTNVSNEVNQGNIRSDQSVVARKKDEIITLENGEFSINNKSHKKIIKDAFYNLKTKEDLERQFESKPIEQYLIPQLDNYSTSLRTHKKPEARKMSKLEAFYDNFITTAKYLDISSMSKAIKSDGYWGNIYNKCIGKNNIDIYNKTYFLYKDMLMCSELSNGIKIIKVVIPQILATDMIIQVHR